MKNLHNEGQPNEGHDYEDLGKWRSCQLKILANKNLPNKELAK